MKCGWLKKFIITIVVALIMNTICFVYYNPLHGSDLNPYRLEPGTIGVNAVEGFGVMYSDDNGFSNPDKPLIDEDYILVMGSSQSKADQIMMDKRYSGLLNEYLGYKDCLGVYNLAYSGGKFYDIVKNFKQLITEYPDSKMIIIEVADGQLTIDENLYQDAMQQIEQGEYAIGEELTQHNILGRLRRFIKVYCPLLLLYVNQYTQWAKMMIPANQTYTDADLNGEKNETKQLQYQWYSDMLKLIKEEYDGELIIVYHNSFVLDEEDNYRYDIPETGKIFIEACRNNGITVLNMLSIFGEHFENARQIPYGFWNTSLGTGHLNRVGHELIAKEIYHYLEGESQ